MKQNMILLHGLFGQLSNWDSVVEEFGTSYNIYVPSLPIYDTPKTDPLYFLVEFLEKFVATAATSHNAVQRSPILKSLTQQVLIAIYQAG